MGMDCEKKSMPKILVKPSSLSSGFPHDKAYSIKGLKRLIHLSTTSITVTFIIYTWFQ